MRAVWESLQQNFSIREKKSSIIRSDVIWRLRKVQPPGAGTMFEVGIIQILEAFQSTLLKCRLLYWTTTDKLPLEVFIQSENKFTPISFKIETSLAVTTLGNFGNWVRHKFFEDDVSVEIDSMQEFDSITTLPLNKFSLKNFQNRRTKAT